MRQTDMEGRQGTADDDNEEPDNSTLTPRKEAQLGKEGQVHRAIVPLILPLSSRGRQCHPEHPGCGATGRSQPRSRLTYISWESANLEFALSDLRHFKKPLDRSLLSGKWDELNCFFCFFSDIPYRYYIF